MVNRKPWLVVCLTALIWWGTACPLWAAASGDDAEELKEKIEDIRTFQDQLMEAVDDLQWFNRLSDIAYVDKAWLYSAPAGKKKTKLKFYSHTFIPKERAAGKIPLMVLAHGGLNGSFQTKYAHIVRELVVQGYAVIAPEFRGSRGFGKKFEEANDKGGRELEDVHMARNFMVETFSFIDENRVGVMGWSIGGFTAGMSVMLYPKDYAAAFSGNPVANLQFRMGYRGKKYNAAYVEMIGKSVEEDPKSYLDRSPAGNAERLQIPYLIHTTTSDRVVRVDEVMTLIDALKKAGKSFEYKIWEDAPGDHSFERMHTPLAREARVEVYQFMARYLTPENPFSKAGQLVEAWMLP